MTYWNEKVVIVTGGSAGLGRAISGALATRGANLVMAARDAPRLENVATELARRGGKIEPIVTDVSRDKDVAQLIDKTLDQFGRIDTLINTVGQSTRQPITETTPGEFRDLIETNFLSAVRCTQAALPHLLNSDGHLVFIGSLASKVALPNLGAYPASKFLLAAYAQQLRLSLHEKKTHVLLVCPGPLKRDDAGSRYDSDAARLPESARRPGGGTKLKAIDPDWLAGRILKGCERRQAELVVPGKARLLFALEQLWPNLGDWIVRRST